MENTNTENRKQFGWITASHPVIYPRYDPAKFIGRSWLVDQVAAMGRESDLQHLVIIGEPGSGKSALIAYLAEAWNCPRHFIRADNKGGVVGVDAKSFLVSIGAQLYQKYGREIFRPDRVLRVNVHAGVAEDQAKIIGLLVDEMFELPFLLQEDRLHGHIEVQVDNARAGSQVTGEHIRHLVNVAQSLHETALLHAAVLEPLQNLHVLYPDETVFLLIDALDESVEHPGRRIVDILPRGGDDLPPNVRLVMTSRPGGDYLARFSTQSLLYLNDESGVNREHSQADTLLYVNARFAQPPLCDRISGWDADEWLGFQNRIAGQSKGNFLYLYHLLNALERDETLTQPSASLETARLPAELDEIYRVFAVDRIRRNSPEILQYHFSVPIPDLLGLVKE